MVIPAQAGMILLVVEKGNEIISYPCTSGDDPKLILVYVHKLWLSLHKRG